MSVRKLGKARIDLDRQLWHLESGDAAFEMNLRLIESRPEIKEIRKGAKAAFVRPPSRRQADQREAHFKGREDYRRKVREALVRAYGEIERESHTYPIPLRKHRDFDHTHQWIYCLFRGVIYQFDKPGYSSDKMIEEITASEGS